MGNIPWKVRAANIQSYLKTCHLQEHVDEFCGMHDLAKTGLDMIRLPISLNFQPDDISEVHVADTLRSLNDFPPLWGTEASNFPVNMFCPFIELWKITSHLPFHLIIFLRRFQHITDMRF